MTFRSPWMLGLLLVVPVLVAAYVSSRRRRAQRAAALADQGLVTVTPGSRTPVRRHVPFGLFIVALSLLLVGMARPSATVKTPRREGTVILAVDVSNSMQADDIKPKCCGDVNQRGAAEQRDDAKRRLLRFQLEKDAEWDACDCRPKRLRV